MSYYKFINYSFNVSPLYSSIRYIWQNTETGEYFIDGVDDATRRIKYFDNYYNAELSTEAKQITPEEIESNTINYKGSQ
jgi:hypothetical protein